MPAANICFWVYPEFATRVKVHVRCSQSHLSEGEKNSKFFQQERLYTVTNGYSKRTCHTFVTLCLHTQQAGIQSPDIINVRKLKSNTKMYSPVLH